MAICTWTILRYSCWQDILKDTSTDMSSSGVEVKNYLGSRTTILCQIIDALTVEVVESYFTWLSFVADSTITVVSVNILQSILIRFITSEFYAVIAHVV